MRPPVTCSPWNCGQIEHAAVCAAGELSRATSYCSPAQNEEQAHQECDHIPVAQPEDVAAFGREHAIWQVNDDTRTA